jgi:hypothetical protein
MYGFSSVDNTIRVGVAEESIDKEISDKMDVKNLASVSPTVKIEAEGSSETLVSMYQTARDYVPKQRRFNFRPAADFNYIKESKPVHSFRANLLKCNANGLKKVL